MEQSPEAPPPRRGPSVDLDPTGIATGKSPDRQRRQFLNYSFYRPDPGVRGPPAEARGGGAAGVHRSGAGVGVFGEPDPRDVLARGPARGRRFHALANRLRSTLLPID